MGWRDFLLLTDTGPHCPLLCRAPRSHRQCYSERATEMTSYLSFFTASSRLCYRELCCLFHAPVLRTLCLWAFLTIWNLGITQAKLAGGMPFLNHNTPYLFPEQRYMPPITISSLLHCWVTSVLHKSFLSLPLTLWCPVDILRWSKTIIILEFFSPPLSLSCRTLEKGTLF